MKIKLSPIFKETTPLSAKIDEDKITVNGEVYDFTPLKEGETLPSDALPEGVFASSIERIEGDIHLTLVLPHAVTAPYETRFPAAYSVAMDVVSGEVPLPPYDEPKAEVLL